MGRSKVVKFLREMLTVLDYVHQKQAIHRDIKPANIIRRWDDGQLCLIDFGAVHDLGSESEEPTTVIGTPGYHAPEQAEGVATFGSDIYSLGMTAIQFLTGQYPLHLPKNESQEVIWRELTQISDRLVAILERMTRVDCVERYECANDVLLDLEAFPLDFGDENRCSNPADSRLTSKLMVVTMLLGLGLGSTATIVNQVESYKTTVEVSFDDALR
ncbi:MAG: protein kinase [Chamaesiphon sp. CSU_1_12]|nr:protein kinase [Chamaesiphon sp. CSU_1_12]